MHPLLPKELGRDFDIESILRWGSLPVDWSSSDRGEALAAYAQLYLAIEVKSSRNVREGELTGLRAITELPGVRRRLVVHMGDRSLATGDGIEILPVPAFFREVENGTIFP